ncbi:MAG: tetratricopeptide repeat protein [bacterium]|nr:tetratricopeptide repeat protein [bacterium]
MIVIITLIALLISGIVLGIIFWKHLAELRMLNVETLPEAREKKMKMSILTRRLERIGQEQMTALRQRFAPLKSTSGKIRGRIEGRLQELELAYERAKQLTLGTRGKRTAQIVGLIREAEELARQEKYEEAERKYIAIITLDNRNVDAYEGLGNLYLTMQKYPEAEEALRFILKFRPQDASVRVSLGEVALGQRKPERALEEFRKAITLRPGNPKYLDYFIETAILVGDRASAEEGLTLLRESNPENQKIIEWGRKIGELKA